MSGGGGGGRGSGGGVSIPAAARRVVQSVREIVNCPEAEIYAMLKECNMDPNEAVHRLLSQDTFHEVKSKRDKKKEIKETPESRSRAVSNSLGRGARGGIDRGGRNSSSLANTSDHGAGRGKPAIKKENGPNTVPTSSILGPGMAPSNSNRRPTVPSNSCSMEDTNQATALAEGACMPSQPSSGFQQNWLGKPGHVSMADIVKMGRPQGKPFSTPVVASDTSYMSHNAPALSNMPHPSTKQSSSIILPSESDQKMHLSQDHVSQVPEISHEVGIGEGQHITHDDWSLVDEQPAGSIPTAQGTSDASAVYADPSTAVYADPSTSSTLSVDGVNLHANPHLDEIQLLDGNVRGESLPTASMRLAPVSERQRQVDNSGDGSHLNDALSKSAYQSQRHAFEHHEVEDVSVEISSATANFHQLSLHKEEPGTKSAENNPAVIIPNHLQVTNADCAHLSFGSFGSGTFSGSFPSKSLKSNLEVAEVAEDPSSVDQSDARNHEYYINGQLNPTPNEDVVSRTTTSTGNLDMPSASQTEVIRNDTLDATHGLQYNFPSVSGYAFSSSTQPNAATYTYPQGNTQTQNLSSFSSLMQPNSLPSSLLAPTGPPLRDFDLPFSPLLSTQSMPTKYSTAVSSISGPTISMPEALKTGVFSTTQTTSQSQPVTSIPTGPALPQHLPVHHYSQPTLPLGPFANMISYPFLPQSYTYLPSAAFQQPYAGNSPFHQSPAALASAGIKYTLPQYKSSVSVTSLPQSAVVSAYGAFGSSTNIPGNFTLNPTTASASTTIGFDESLSSQYKEGNHYMPLQQAENPAMWVHGAGSRTMSALPASTFYNFQGQSQHSGFRQGQQPSQFGGALGYPNFYHTPSGVSQEHQQNPSEGNLNGSQTTPSQPSHQIWQHSY